MKIKSLTAEEANQMGLDLADNVSIQTEADVINRCDEEGIVNEAQKKAILDAWHWAMGVKAEFEKPNPVDTLWTALNE